MVQPRCAAAPVASAAPIRSAAGFAAPSGAASPRGAFPPRGSAARPSSSRVRSSSSRPRSSLSSSSLRSSSALRVSCASSARDSIDPARRVVITGTGLVSALGSDVDAAYSSMLRGERAVGRITQFDASAFPVTIAAEARDSPEERFVEAKWRKRTDRVMRHALVAAKGALERAGLPWRREEFADALPGWVPHRAGIVLGSAMGGIGTFEASVGALVGGKKMNPFCIPFAISNASSGMLSVDLGFGGPVYSLSTACATGNYAIMAAAEDIREGRADLMLAGGADAAVTPASIGGFAACKALSRRNDDPLGASRPWDESRDGFVMGEGAGVVVLESLEHAQRRGAPLLAEVVAFAAGSDAHHVTEPDPSGAGVRRCIELAIERAGLSSSSDRARIGYVNAHGTSTPAGDVAELAAVRGALPSPELVVNSTKGLIGHALGAASGIEAVVAVQALRTGKIHPNPNLVNVDPRIPDADAAVLAPRDAHVERPDLEFALSNSFGFGGHNSVLVLGKM